ncbi:MAG: helix-turn-helix domain-containing protein [Candidatus Bathyarchaeia archaeon]
MSGILEIGSKALLKEECTKGWHFKGRLKSLLMDEIYKKEIGEIEKYLVKFGLSKNEARVYIFLVKCGARKASEISSLLSLNRTETYKILINLQKVDLVSVILGRPLRFAALPLEDSLNLPIKSRKLTIRMLEEESEKIIGIWRSLPTINVFPIKKDFFQILEGYENVILKAKDIIEGSSKNLCAAFTIESHLYKFYYAGLFDSMEKVAGRGVKVMFIAAAPPGAFFLRDLRKCSTKCVRYGNDELLSFITSDDEMLLLFLEPKFSGDGESGKPVTLYTNYAVLVKAFNKVFWSAWEEIIEK